MLQQAEPDDFVIATAGQIYLASSGSHRAVAGFDVGSGGQRRRRGWRRSPQRPRPRRSRPQVLAPVGNDLLLGNAEKAERSLA